MARRKKSNTVHGWLILNKPINMTSTQAVGAVRCAFNAQKAGHSGTLDPLATGILPIALGEATKAISFAVDGEKTYRFTVRWGAETETDDTEGTVTNTSDKRSTRAEIEALLPCFHGEVIQVPPTYSAIKIDGARAYDLARGGETVMLEPRPVVIDSLSLVDMPDDATSVFEARCGKGTYMRALARDMGRLMGCYGHVIALHRTEVGPFDEAIAVNMDTLLAAADSGDPARIAKLLLPVESVLADLPELRISQSDAATLARGQTVLIRGRDAPITTGGPTYATSKGRLIALGELAKGTLRPTRVFNLS